jgi:uncharacterized membrane protein
MEQARDSNRPAGLSTQRIEALSDGVFAIAITLLVLNFHIPNIPPSQIASKLPGSLTGQWPQLLSYVLTFLVVGVYWVGHHNQFHYIRRADRTLLWINILFLMCVAFVPFSAGLLGPYGRQAIAVQIYGANLIATGLVLYLHWWYATRGARLLDRPLDRHVVRDASRRILVAPLAYLLAIALSFLSPEASLVVYALVPWYYLLPGHIDRHFFHLSSHPPHPAETTVSHAPDSGPSAERHDSHAPTPSLLPSNAPVDTAGRSEGDHR